MWSYSPRTCQCYMLEIKTLCVCYLFKLELGLVCVESWSELDSERIKYGEIGGSGRESGMILAKGSPVYSCYCYRRDELIWYLTCINDEGLRLGFKLCLRPCFYAAGLYFSTHLETVLQHHIFILTCFYCKGVLTRWFYVQFLLLIIIMFHVIVFSRLNDQLIKL